MSPILGAGKQILWIFSRTIFLLLRSIIWILLFRYFKILANYRESAYKRTVHVQRILARHKLDALIQPASANNFLTMHKRFVDPEYVLSKNVTLYCTTNRTAYFVECDPSIDVMSSDVSSFFRIAQYKNAINLIAIPMHIFHKLGTSVGKPHGQLVILINTARCGSTLLSQVFEETHQCISISEPDASNTLSTLSAKLPEVELDKLTRTTIHMLCKNSTPSTKACIIKLSQNNTLLVPYLCRVFPDVKTLFIYRNGLDVSKSIAKLMQGTPMIRLLIALTRNSTCIKFAKCICKLANVPVQQFKDFKVIKSDMEVGAICWASAMRGYLNFLDNGLDIAAATYEDMVGDTSFAMNQIFQYCGIEYNQKAVEEAFSRDSQRGSPISREELGKFDHIEITKDIQQQTDDACKLFNVPSIYETYIAENTITHRPLCDDVTNEGGETQANESFKSLQSSEENCAAVTTADGLKMADTKIDIPSARPPVNQVPNGGMPPIHQNNSPTAHKGNSVVHTSDISSDTRALVTNSYVRTYGSCVSYQQ